MCVLYFPCAYLDQVREFHYTIRLGDRGAEFTEDDGFLGYRDVLLSTMVNVIHANADQLLGIVNGSPQIVGVWLENVAVSIKGILHCSKKHQCTKS